jgi:hypothetical protein
MTQLSMRTFHTSGSCDLDVEQDVVQFFYNYLIDIEHINKDQFKIILNNDLPEELLVKISKLPGFIQFIDSKTILCHNIFHVENKDVTKVIRDINNLLRKETGKKITSVVDVYHQYIQSILDVGDIYSTFVEIVLCNMYLTKDREILRYAINRDINMLDEIDIKLTHKTLHTAVSKLLGLLYEPNSGSICTFADSSNPLPICSDTVFEKLWTGMF